MVTILVIAHGPLASALTTAAQHVYSRDPCTASHRLLWLDVAPDADAGAVLAQAQALVQQADQGDGVLVMTDLYGATPGNVACKLARSGHVAVLAGVNMPMLLRALCYGESKLDDLVAKALAGGMKGLQQVPTRAESGAAPADAKPA